MMGCAIGMSIIAAFEIFYWIIVKPFMKLKDNQNPSPTQKRFSGLLHLFAFVACIVFAWYRFKLVYQVIEEKSNYIYG